MPLRMAMGMEAHVTVIDSSVDRLRQLDEMFGTKIYTRYSTLDAIEEHVIGADLVIGAVLVPGAAAPKLVTPQDDQADASRARSWSTSPSTRAAASRPRRPPPMPIRSMSSTASSTTASPTCRAA